VIDHLGLSRMLVLLVASLIIFGPDRLPEIAAQVGRGLHKFRTTVNNLGAEVRTSVQAEVGDLDFKSLDPRVFVKELLEDTPAPVVAAPVVYDLPTGTDAMTLLNAADDGLEIPAEWLIDTPQTNALSLAKQAPAAPGARA
jgi:sec-independent protein translocase protein TatB